MESIDVLDSYFSKFQDTFEHIKEIYEVQKDMGYKMYHALQNKDSVIVCQGFTGMGKSLVIDVVAMKFADEGKRVLISSPVYSALQDNHESPLRALGYTSAVMHGFSWWKKKKNYHCLIDPTLYPNKRMCSKGQCKEEQCEVYQEIQLIGQREITLTVHHKIASAPSIIKDENFDIIIIDESHNLPQIIENLSFKYMTTLKLLENLKGKEITPRTKKILDNVNKTGIVRKSEIRKVLREIKTISLDFRDDDLGFLARARKLEYKNGKWIFFSPLRTKGNLKPDISVALVSATIEAPSDHIRDCRFDSLSQAPHYIAPLTKRFRKRFEKRPIYYLSDGPILRKDQEALEVYESFRQESNRLIYELVMILKNHVTLILCRANQDAISIQTTLEKNQHLRNQVVYLGDDDERDTDEIEGYLKEEITAKGKKLIISTAKNGLWEGANVPYLQCVIIDALPYRTPLPTEEPLKSRGGFYRSSMFRYMLRRLQQGIGRLVRSDDQWGIAIIVDGRMYTGKRWIHKQLPQWIAGQNIMYLENTKTIVQAVGQMKNKLLEGEAGIKNKTLNDFLE